MESVLFGTYRYAFIPTVRQMNTVAAIMILVNKGKSLNARVDCLLWGFPEGFSSRNSVAMNKPAITTPQAMPRTFLDSRRKGLRDSEIRTRIVLHTTAVANNRLLIPNQMYLSDKKRHKKKYRTTRAQMGRKVTRRFY